MKNIIFFLVFFGSMGLFSQSNELVIADSLYAYGNYTKAIANYNKLPKKDNVYYKIAKAYIALGNYGLAQENFKKAIKANEENLLLKYDYAKLLSSNKYYNEASLLFNELIIKDSLNPNFYYEKGIVLEKLKDSLAIENYIKAIDLDPKHQKAIFKLTKFHLVKRRHEKVHELVNMGLESYNENKKLISLKAQNYYWQDDFHNAIKWFKKLIDLNESTQFIHEKLSLCYSYVYDYQKAIEHAEIALQFDQKNANNLYLLGQLNSRLLYFKKAEEYFKKSFEIQDVPLDKEYIELARVLNRQYKYSEAIEVFKKALKENPDNPSVKFYLLNTRDKFYTNIDKRIKLHENFIKLNPKDAYISFAKERLSRLKEEKFMKADSTQVSNNQKK